MHELSLCRAIAETAIAAAEGRSVRRISLQIGHFRQVVPVALEHCWSMRVRGTVLDDCALDVEYVPARVRCRGCAEVTQLDVPALKCASCGANDVELMSGEEFLICSIDVDTAVDDRTNAP